jgi:hypothetical protein
MLDSNLEEMLDAVFDEAEVKENTLSDEDNAALVEPPPTRRRLEPAVAIIDPYRANSPAVHAAFLDELIGLRGSHEYELNGVKLAYLLHDVKNGTQSPTDTYVEPMIAQILGLRLRVVPQEWATDKRPVYPMPRLLRFAALMGNNIVEIDLVSSHFRQLKKYAMLHQLECPIFVSA